MAFLGATLVLSAWLAWEAVVAARTHREVAEEVLTDYAAVAASESARLSRDVVDDFLDELFDDVPRFTRREELPDPVVVAEEVDRALRDEGCPCPGLREPLLVFRHDVAEDTVVVHGSGTLSSRDEAVRALHEHRTGGPEEVRFQGLTLLVGPSGSPSRQALLYHVTRGGDGEVRSVYGYLVPVGALRELLAWRVERSTLLPASVLGETPQDSLLRVRYLGPDGAELGGEETDDASPFRTRSPLPREQGGLATEVSVRPEAASDLVIGGLPRSRLPLLLGLLLVTVGVGGAGLVELRRSHELARLREDFVSSVSHELRTPLTQIRMLAELLEEEKLPSAEERARSTRIIRREAQRLTMLVENILQFSRSRAAPGSAAPEAPRLSLEEVVDESVALLEPLVARGEASVALELDREGGPLEARIHRESVRRIVGNLLDNALKYGPAGQTVRLSLRRTGEDVLLHVDDEGPGIPDEERDGVWEAYRRLPRDVEARRPGSGLGLAVVRELVERHGGDARIEEAPGGGTRVRVRLPAAPAEEG